MKKLMIAAAIVCAAVFAQASSFNWQISGMATVKQAGTSTVLASGTAYLFDSATYSQVALLNAAITDAGIDMTKAISAATSAVSSGVLSGNTPTATLKGFDYGTDGVKNNLYMVIIDDGKVFVSATTGFTGQVGKTITGTLSGNGSNKAAVDWTKDGTFSAGWYNTVPEPTSGLLLLLGVAGLALRRRRA